MSRLDAQLRDAVRRSLDAGWSMLGLCNDAGVPRGSIRDWYVDGKGLKTDTAFRLAEYYGMRFTRPKIRKPSERSGA